MNNLIKKWGGIGGLTSIDDASKELEQLALDNLEEAKS